MISADGCQSATTERQRRHLPPRPPPQTSAPNTYRIQRRSGHQGPNRGGHGKLSALPEADRSGGAPQHRSVTVSETHRLPSCVHSKRGLSQPGQFRYGSAHTRGRRPQRTFRHRTVQIVPGIGRRPFKTSGCRNGSGRLWQDAATRATAPRAVHGCQPSGGAYCIGLPLRSRSRRPIPCSWRCVSPLA